MDLSMRTLAAAKSVEYGAQVLDAQDRHPRVCIGVAGPTGHANQRALVDHDDEQAHGGGVQGQEMSLA